MDGDKPKRQRSERYPIGSFHIDIAEVHTAEGELCLYDAIHYRQSIATHCPERDPTSKFAVARLVEKADRRTAWGFLKHLLGRHSTRSTPS